MPRKKIPLSPDLPYHIYARCINRDWFDQPLVEIWEIMENYLYFINKAYKVQILSFVLMNNHFHLILRCPKLNLSEAMRYFMGETSRRITKSSHRINQTYGSRYGRCLINSYHYYTHAYKYVYRNPIKAGLCERVEDYTFSTLRGLIGGEKLNIPLQEDLTLFSSLDDTLKWLNRRPPKQNEEAVRKALSKECFSLGVCEKTQQRHQLETFKL